MIEEIEATIRPNEQTEIVDFSLNLILFNIYSFDKKKFSSSFCKNSCVQK